MGFSQIRCDHAGEHDVSDGVHHLIRYHRPAAVNFVTKLSGNRKERMGMATSLVPLRNSASASTVPSAAIIPTL